MSRFYSYINSAKEILTAYSGEEPFASFVKRYFSLHKKYGSKDRKQISHLCYCYFRLRAAGKDLPHDERILIALYLCSDKPNEILEAIKPGWNDKVSLSLNEKLSIIDLPIEISKIFSWKDKLSEGIDYEKFNNSFFIQPDLFLRLRPGNEKQVKRKLTEAGISFQEINQTCLSLSNATKLDDVIETDKEAVIQDYNSQQVGQFFLNNKPQTINHKLSIWDCCAASGGKSIMLFDLLGDIQLTVSDVRESILTNLKKRFARAGIKNYKSFVADISISSPLSSKDQFDFVIADVPCSGSGTWSRTPEQLYYFKENRIEDFSSLQKKIVSNIYQNIKLGGILMYITCSVFKKENEEVVDFITSNFSVQLIKMELLKGYTIKADTMFVALLQKSL